jgi:hypothetical protein
LDGPSDETAKKRSRCHSRCGAIGINLCSKVICVEHMRKSCSPTPDNSNLKFLTIPPHPPGKKSFPENVRFFFLFPPPTKWHIYEYITTSGAVVIAVAQSSDDPCFAGSNPTVGRGPVSQYVWNVKEN